MRTLKKRLEEVKKSWGNSIPSKTERPWKYFIKKVAIKDFSVEEL